MHVASCDLLYSVPRQPKSNSSLSKDSLPVIKIGNEPGFYINIHGRYAWSLGSSFQFYPNDITSIKFQQVGNFPEFRDVKYKEEGLCLLPSSAFLEGGSNLS